MELCIKLYAGCLISGHFWWYSEEFACVCMGCGSRPNCISEVCFSNLMDAQCYVQMFVSCNPGL